MEAKIDAILLAVDPQKAETIMREIAAYAGRHTDTQYVARLERQA